MRLKKLFKNVFIFVGRQLFNEHQPKDIPNNPSKILIFSRKAIGDIIMTTPAFKALRISYPKSHISFWTMEWNREIVELIDYFDEVIFLDNSTVMHKNIFGLLNFLISIRRQKYDMVITFDTFMFPLYFYLAGIPIRVGYEFDREGFALTHKVKISEANYRLDNFLDVAALAGADIKDKRMDLFFKSGQSDREENQNILSKDFSLHNNIIGIFPGGGNNPGQKMAAKHWIRRGFAEVISELVKKDDVLILIFGKGDDDQIIAKEILQIIKEKIIDFDFYSEKIKNLVNKTTLAQAASILIKCNLLLTNDTAFMHLAAVVGTPTLSIFGPTDPRNLAPRGPEHRSIKSSLPCSPCYERKGYLNCKSECMEEITWERVYNEVINALQGNMKRNIRERNAYCC